MTNPASLTPPPRRWRNLLINKRYQTKLIVWTVSATAVAGFSLLSLLAYLMNGNYALLLDRALPNVPSQAILNHEFGRVMGILWALVAGLLILVGYVTLVLSHKSAGALFAFRRTFRAVADGNRAARIRLRPQDDFQEEAAAFNAMMDQVFPPVTQASPSPTTSET